MCTASTLCTVSIPMTSIAALPTLKIPYFALNDSRSPTGNGTALTMLPVHTWSWAPRAPVAASSASTTIVAALRAALIRLRERHAARTCCHGLDRDGRCLRSYRAVLETTSIRRALAPRRARSSAFAAHPSVASRGEVAPFRVAWRSTTRRSARKPEMESFTPTPTRSKRGAHCRAHRSGQERVPCARYCSATTRSAPDSRRLTISSIVSGACTKSAWSVIAQSRFGRSVRCKATRSNSSRLFAYPCREGWWITVSGRTRAYDANTSADPSVEASSHAMI